MKATTTLKISISGVRGIIGDSLTPQLAAALAQAFGTYVGGGPILIGRDARRSGIMLTEAVTAGLLSVGGQPIDAGICSIPTFLYLTKAHKAAGGIAVTASHNPKPWNGLKFISRDGLYLTPHQTEEFLDIYHQGEFADIPADRYKTASAIADGNEPHLRKILAHIDAAKIRKRRFRVALDCNNGAGAVLAPRLLAEFGCEVIPIFTDPSGEFAHDPEPLPENITAVCRAVRESKADIGFVQDADADRLAVVDEKGVPLGEETTLALAVRYVLGKKKGSVVCNLSTSRVIDDIAAARGVKVFRTKIGEINVVEKLLAAKPKAVIGGEGNGGVIYPDVHPCRDSFTAMGLILEALADAGRPISALAGTLPRYVMIKEKIEGSAESAHRLVGLLKKIYESRGLVDLRDGLKVEFADHWIHVRPSNTEPVIRVLAEARTKAVARRAIERLKADISGLRKKMAS
jgi:phosphomannomutase